MNTEKLKNIEKQTSELVEKIMKAKSQYNNNSVLNIFNQENITNPESNLLASYAYDLEKLILLRVLIEAGHESIAIDFDKSASFIRHKDGIVNENTEILQSSCKLFGEEIDSVFDKVRNNCNKYLEFLVEDAAGPKNFVKQANSFN
jgi:hypothetical protein